MGVSTTSANNFVVDGRKLIVARSVSRLEANALPTTTAGISVSLWYSTNGGVTYSMVPGASTFLFAGSGLTVFAPFLLPASCLLAVRMNSPTIAYTGVVSVTVN